MMNCKQATRMVSAGLDRKLALSERLALRVHLFLCERCTHFARQSRFLRQAAQAAARRDKSDAER
jgi:hypothetical protein